VQRVFARHSANKQGRTRKGSAARAKFGRCRSACWPRILSGEVRHAWQYACHGRRCWTGCPCAHIRSRGRPDTMLDRLRWIWIYIYAADVSMSTNSTTETCVGWTSVLPAQSDQPIQQKELCALEGCPPRLISRVFFFTKVTDNYEPARLSLFSSPVVSINSRQHRARSILPSPS
jgi:hypothetical protein